MDILISDISSAQQHMMVVEVDYENSMGVGLFHAWCCPFLLCLDVLWPSLPCMSSI